MSDQPKSTSVRSPEVCFFRYSALVNLPETWRVTLIHFGIAAFDLALEVFGQAPEAPDSVETTRAVLLAVASDLRTVHEQLEEAAAALELSELTPEEIRLCRAAGGQAPQVRELEQALRRAVRGA